MITSKIICDSLFENRRLTTFELTYPRIIHSEFLTHRCFARNAASSRAIPITKMIEAVHRDGNSVFEYWGSNKPGMQAGEQLTGDDLHRVKTDWTLAAQEAATFAGRMSEHGLHKQNANRLLEPFLHITVIATATDIGLANFFNLRAHPAAQPEFQVLAFRMLDTLLKSTPQSLNDGDWHLPMADGLALYDMRERLKVCTGRIARVSYLKHDTSRAPYEDIDLHDKLVLAGHWSPFEHCARACSQRLNDRETGCFGHHWKQYRKLFATENRTMLDPVKLMEAKPDWITI